MPSEARQGRASGYRLLSDVRVLEVSLLAPDSAGQHLADLGADVIKIEQPPHGDHVRGVSPTALGSPAGPSLMHLTYNRGKRSLALDLKHPDGQDVFLELVRCSDAVVEGLRPGTLARWGLPLDRLRAENPRLVFCSLSGFGGSGPYRDLATHGVAYDAWAGLVPPEMAPDGTPRIPHSMNDPVGITAGGLYAALATLAAIVNARATGEGAMVEVAEADAAALWWKERIEWRLNRPLMRRRATYGAGEEDGPGSLHDSVRYQYYDTADGRLVLFQSVEAKFFANFCRAVGREDLLERFPGPAYDQAAGNEELRAELREIFRTRTQAEWIELFLACNVAGAPVNRREDLPDDEHFLARENLYDVHHPELGRLRLTTTPIKVPGEVFDAEPAPACGEHTVEVLASVLGFDARRVDDLARRGIIGLKGDGDHGGS